MQPPPDAVEPEGVELTRKAWRFLESRATALGVPGLTVVPLCDFLHETTALQPKPEERKIILEQAELVFREVYAHRPFKEKRYKDAQPLVALQNLREDVETGTVSELEFHIRVLDAFTSVHDAHTIYTLPPPFNQAVAFLPFRLGLARTEDDQLGFYVTRIMDTSERGGFGHPTFGTGARVVKWNGVPIRDAVVGANQVGGNESARLARGLVRATLRPLTVALPPMAHEETVTVEFIAMGSTRKEVIRLMWGASKNLVPNRGIPGLAFSINAAQCAEQYAQRALWKRGGWTVKSAPPVSTEASTDAPLTPGMSVPPAPRAVGDIFESQHSNGTPVPNMVQPEDLRDPANPDKRFGYVRIREFDGANSPLSKAKGLQREFRSILTQMNEVAPDGLIVDIRGNPGGEIEAAEEMLQMLTPAPLQPARFHLANTSTLRSVLSKLRENSRESRFSKWANDETDPQQPLTSGQTISDTAAQFAQGQAYIGPVVLVIDGFTYSAADIFAGGFSDHGVGPIVGVGSRTGGGGASVWRHAELLSTISGIPGVNVSPLPETVSMMVAGLRSSRVRHRKGRFIEDVGVEADHRYLPTFDDIIGTFGGLFRFICTDVFSTLPSLRIEVPGAPEITPDGIRLQVLTRGITRLVFSINKEKRLAMQVNPGSTVPVLVPGPIPASGEVLLIIEGFEGNRRSPSARPGITVRERAAVPERRTVVSASPIGRAPAASRLIGVKRGPVRQ